MLFVQVSLRLLFLYLAAVENEAGPLPSHLGPCQHRTPGSVGSSPLRILEEAHGRRHPSGRYSGAGLRVPAHTRPGRAESGSCKPAKLGLWARREGAGRLREKAHMELLATPRGRGGGHTRDSCGSVGSDQPAPSPRWPCSGCQDTWQGTSEDLQTAYSMSLAAKLPGC